MCNPALWGHIKPDGVVTCHSGNDVRRQIEDETRVDKRCVTFDARESCEQHQKGGAA
jgi:hypothetical protein